MILPKIVILIIFSYHRLVLSALKENKKIANATHNIYAYRIRKDGENNCLQQDCEDDGETAAGGRLLHLLQVVHWSL